MVVRGQRKDKVFQPGGPVLPADDPFFLAPEFFYQGYVLGFVPEIEIVVIKEYQRAFAFIPGDVYRLAVDLYVTAKLIGVFTGSNVEEGYHHIDG